MLRSFLTSEAALGGHPDKVCDRIAEAVLDAALTENPDALASFGVTVHRDSVDIVGELTNAPIPDCDEIARGVIESLGFTVPGRGFDALTCKVHAHLHGQSEDITRVVQRAEHEDAGAGDQGVMHGCACLDTPHLMPLPISLARDLVRKLEQLRASGIFPGLLPDGKAQVTVEYTDHEPRHISTVVVSAQHEEGISLDDIRDFIVDNIIEPLLPPDLIDRQTAVFVNPAGPFTAGGPGAHAGFSGRKNVMDTYGGYIRDGGNSPVGKDPSRMDRSGSLMARYLAKNIVAAGIAKRCETQLVYVMGLTDPVSVSVETDGTGCVPDSALVDWILGHIDLRPPAIIRRFDLRRPIYQKLSSYGPFDRTAEDMPWERTDLIPELREEFM